MTRGIPVELRFYKRFDSDILALADLGIPVAKLADAALHAYAEGKRVRYLVTSCRPCEITRDKPLHCRIITRTPEAAALIKRIRKGYRNQFVKALIRDALVCDPVWQFFIDGKDVEREKARLSIAAGQGDPTPILISPEEKRPGHYRDWLLRQASGAGGRNMDAGAMYSEESTGAPSLPIQGNSTRRENGGNTSRRNDVAVPLAETISLSGEDNKPGTNATDAMGERAERAPHAGGRAPGNSREHNRKRQKDGQRQEHYGQGNTGRQEENAVKPSDNTAGRTGTPAVPGKNKDNVEDDFMKMFDSFM